MSLTHHHYQYPHIINVTYITHAIKCLHETILSYLKDYTKIEEDDKNQILCVMGGSTQRSMSFFGSNGHQVDSAKCVSELLEREKVFKQP